MTDLHFKIVPRAEWEAESGDYQGSAHDRADGFLQFSTAAQLLADHYTWDAIAASTIAVYASAFSSHAAATTVGGHA